MRQIVLQVIQHTRTSVNGRDCHRYKLKLKEGQRIFIADGFSNSSSDVLIQIGDVLEYMQIVDKLNGEQLCKVFYEAKEIEKNTNKCNISTEKKRMVHKIVSALPKVIKNVQKPQVEQLSLY